MRATTTIKKNLLFLDENMQIIHENSWQEWNNSFNSYASYYFSYLMELPGDGNFLVYRKIRANTHNTHATDTKPTRIMDMTEYK